jgi:hypothetical protein
MALLGRNSFWLWKYSNHLSSTNSKDRDWKSIEKQEIAVK